MIVAGGTENMSSAPYLLAKARNGYRMGNGELIDSMIRDGLWDVYNNVHMGTCGDRCARTISVLAPAAGRFRGGQLSAGDRGPAEGACLPTEIVPVEIANRHATITVDRDEGPSRFNEEKLRQLAARLRQEGNRHRRQRFEHQRRRRRRGGDVGRTRPSQLGVQPQARILGYATCSREPEWFTLAPIGAIGKSSWSN